LHTPGTWRRGGELVDLLVHGTEEVALGERSVGVHGGIQEAVVAGEVVVAGEGGVCKKIGVVCEVTGYCDGVLAGRWARRGEEKTWIVHLTLRLDAAMEKEEKDGMEENPITYRRVSRASIGDAPEALGNG
jgi:hypothetical protein